jgi:hypothetical protein
VAIPNWNHRALLSAWFSGIRTLYVTLRSLAGPRIRGELRARQRRLRVRHLLAAGCICYVRVAQESGWVSIHLRAGFAWSVAHLLGVHGVDMAPGLHWSGVLFCAVSCRAVWALPCRARVLPPLLTASQCCVLAVQTKRAALLQLHDCWEQLEASTPQPSDALQQHVAQVCAAAQDLLERQETLLKAVGGVLDSVGSHLPQLLSSSFQLGADLHHSPVMAVSGHTSSTRKPTVIGYDRPSCGLEFWPVAT